MSGGVLETINGIIQRGQPQFGGNSAGNAPTLLMLGGFKFSLNTAVFQQVERSTSYRWPGIELIGKVAALQYVGAGDDTINLPGVVYPDFKGGMTQVSDLRTLAGEGRPLKLIASTGEILGAWVIESISETQSEFKPDGSFRKQEFAVSLKKYSDNADL